MALIMGLSLLVYSFAERKLRAALRSQARSENPQTIPPSFGSSSVSKVFCCSPSTQEKIAETKATNMQEDPKTTIRGLRTTVPKNVFPVIGGSEGGNKDRFLFFLTAKVFGQRNLCFFDRIRHRKRALRSS